jgi:16S rRNA C1402 (ribose-2'-O) methylase RsmI
VALFFTKKKALLISITLFAKVFFSPKLQVKETYERIKAFSYIRLVYRKQELLESITGILRAADRNIFTKYYLSKKWEKTRRTELERLKVTVFGRYIRKATFIIIHTTK